MYLPASIGPRGAAWSKINPGRGLGLKKQSVSDWARRYLRRDGEGAGRRAAGFIAITVLRKRRQCRAEVDCSLRRTVVVGHELGMAEIAKREWAS